MRDEKVVLYATYLPRGTYQFNYVIYPGLAGEYNVIPTTGQEFYFPEVYGRSDGMLFTITGGAPSDAMVPAEAAATPEATEEVATEEAATPEVTEAATEEATAEPTEAANEVATEEATAEPTEAATEEATEAAATEEPVTPEATEAAAETPAGDDSAAALTQTFTSTGGITISYPEGWVGRESESGEIELADSAETLTAADDPDSSIQPGQLAFIVLGALPIDALGMGDEPALTDVMTAIGSQLASGGDTKVGDATEITLGDVPAARIDTTNAVERSEGFVIGFMGDGSTLIVVAAVAPRGELADAEDLFLAMAASVSYAAPAP